ncbi:hypothetical protein ACPUVO_13970 [Pseudocolwellia sp. HL-MZ19]|uniref:hypothetical protein n=1 Tax=Pseudocolwellia sp. HL-MZ19 TaxID=3400846 RepID=UPI003CEB527E
MMILGDKRQKTIDSLNLSDSLKKLVKGEFIHDELEFRCFKLKYSLEPDDFSPQGVDLVPLWESDLTITGFYLDGNLTPVFIHYDIESIEDYKVIAKSLDGLVEFLVSEYVEYDYEDEVRKLLKR